MSTCSFIEQLLILLNKNNILSTFFLDGTHFFIQIVDHERNERADHPKADRPGGGNLARLPQPNPPRPTALSESGGDSPRNGHRHQQGDLGLGLFRANPRRGSQGMCQ